MLFGVVFPPHVDKYGSSMLLSVAVLVFFFFALLLYQMMPVREPQQEGIHPDA